jgi:hypothetical protein
MQDLNFQDLNFQDLNFQDLNFQDLNFTTWTSKTGPQIWPNSAGHKSEPTRPQDRGNSVR